MNEYAVMLLQNKINKALADARISRRVDHPYLEGHLKETFVSNLIGPLLNANYSLGSGKVTDYKGAKSKEIDVLIFSNSILPPFFFRVEEKIKVYPIESVLKCIEVKSILNKQNLELTYSKCKYLEDNLTLTSGYFDDFDIPLPHIFTRHKYEIFAYGCNIKSNFKDYFLKIYKKIDPLWDVDPLITSVCVAGKGWFAFTRSGWVYLSNNATNNNNQEVVGYLCATVHGLERIALSRGYPRIGQYLMSDEKGNFNYSNI